MLKINKAEIAPYTVIICFTFYYLITKSVLDLNVEWLVWSGAIIFLFCMLSNKWTNKEFVLMGLIMISGMISSKLSSNYSIIMLYMIIFISIKLDYKKVFKLVFWIFLLFFIYVFVLSFVDPEKNIILIRGGVRRQGMGFSHPNIVGMYLFLIVSLYLIIYGKQLDFFKKVLISLFWGGIVFLVYQKTHTRTSVILIIMLLIVFIVFESKFLSKYIAGLCKVLPYATIFFAILSTVMFSSSIFNRLNMMLNSRIGLSFSMLENVGFSLFGKVIPYIYSSNNYYVLDSGYWNLMLGNGIINYIIVISLFFLLIKDLYEKKEYFMIMVVNFFLIYAMIENMLNTFSYNIFAIMFGNIIFNNSALVLKMKKRLHIKAG